LVRSAVALRRAGHAGIEPPSTRLLVAAARLVVAGLPLAEAVRVGIVNPLSAEGPAEIALEELLVVEGVLTEPGPGPA
jgi:nitric oxide reductase NorQ protein